MPAGTPRNRKLVCLTGFMGSGKTTVGRLLAQQLGWMFVDLDTKIEERAGLGIPQIFERQGESAFRELEYDVLKRSLGQIAAQKKPAVVALGGGTITRPSSLDLLRESGGLLVWLDCPVEELLSRCATVTNRPLFRDEAGFRALYAQRRPLYEQADYRVLSTGEPRRVVEQLLALELLEKVTA